MYSMVTIVNNIVLYTWNVLREILRILTTHQKSQPCELDMLISLIVVIAS